MINHSSYSGTLYEKAYNSGYVDGMEYMEKKFKENGLYPPEIMNKLSQRVKTFCEFVSSPCPFLLLALPYYQKSEARTREIINEHLNGDTLEIIGQRHRITRERVRKILVQQERRINLSTKLNCKQKILLYCWDFELQKRERLLQQKENVFQKKIQESETFSFIEKVDHLQKLLLQITNEDKNMKDKVIDLDVPIEELNLSTRGYYCLIRAGIKTIGILGEKSHRNLKEIKNMGKKTIEEIEYKLFKKYGLKLKEE